MNSGDVTTWGFVVIGAAILGVEVAARRPGSRIPTLGRLAAFVMRERWGRFGVLFVWWWIGWHLLSRS